MSFAAAMVMAEARRRRDDRGRYMEDGSSRNEMAYNEGGAGGEMRRGGRRNEIAYNEGRQGDQMRRGERGSRNEMGGEGYFAWDGNYPMPYLTPERYGRPEMENDGNITDMREYERRRNMRPSSHMGKDWREKTERQNRIGFGEHDEDEEDEDDEDEKLNREQAEKWVREMKTPDDKPLQPVAMSEIQRIAPNYGIEGEHKLVEFWLVTNMMKSDYQDMGAKYAGNAVDFYAGLAKDWLHDKDAVPNKLKMYKKYIAQKEK